MQRFLIELAVGVNEKAKNEGDEFLQEYACGGATFLQYVPAEAGVEERQGVHSFDVDSSVDFPRTLQHFKDSLVVHEEISLA